MRGNAVEIEGEGEATVRTGSHPLVDGSMEKEGARPNASLLFDYQ